MFVFFVIGRRVAFCLSYNRRDKKKGPPPSLYLLLKTCADLLFQVTQCRHLQGWVHHNITKPEFYKYRMGWIPADQYKRRLEMCKFLVYFPGKFFNPTPDTLERRASVVFILM